MPKRDDIQTVLIIGSGPIVIGQACEFDYSGVQACQALRQEGYRVVLVNSNPATLMTDSSMADATYIESMRAEVLERIIASENVDAILPTMGGQTAINLTMELHRSGFLRQNKIKVIGADPEVIERAENRLQFNRLLTQLQLESPQGEEVRSVQQAWNCAERFGFPLIVRPSYTLGGKGGGIVESPDQFEASIALALAASPIDRAFVEESVLGWKEFELEVIRDRNDNCIVVCSIENLDPMGVHTGDSITVAPALTLTDKEFQVMRDAAFKVVRGVGVETGGANVQFAVDPQTGRMVVIEMNPRVSRSSALASKATGFPIAKVATLLAVGYTLDEISNEVTQKSCAAFEPSIDYVVTKIPRFDFAKFKGVVPKLTTSMQSVGEVMALGRTFPESLQKALRSLEQNHFGLTNISYPYSMSGEEKKNSVRQKLSSPSPETLFYIAEAYRLGLTESEIYQLCHWDPWFLRQIEALVVQEQKIATESVLHDAQTLRYIKSLGFSNQRIAELSAQPVAAVEQQLENYEIRPHFRRVDTCAGEFSSPTAYLYSCVLPFDSSHSLCEAQPTLRKKVVILGSGPNRIGQGIEFDYCCVKAAQSVRELGFEAIMINCNPETVSTDHTISDKLYFSPLTPEDVLDIIARESEIGLLAGVLVQFGGQTAIKLAQCLQDKGIAVLGTSVDSIDLVEDRDRFRFLAQDIARQPKNTAAFSKDELQSQAKAIGFPIVIRPSYVIGGQFIAIIDTPEELAASPVIQDFDRFKPLLLERFLQNALELEVDALSDGEAVHIAGLMRHFEMAGVHSGDSSCILPATGISDEIVREIEIQTHHFAQSLGVKGLFNIQFAVQQNQLYILEVNPRASRTVPFVSKATNVNLCELATQIMLGKRLKDFHLPSHKDFGIFAIKRPVFSFDRLPGVIPRLGPEMRSTGEAMSYASSPEEAIAKALGFEVLEALKRFNKAVVLQGKDVRLQTKLCEVLRQQEVEVSVIKSTTSRSQISQDLLQLICNEKVGLVFNVDAIDLADEVLKKLLEKQILLIATCDEIDAVVQMLDRFTLLPSLISLQERHGPVELKEAI